MSTGLVLAIDQGTSGTKAIVVNERLEVVSCVEQEVRPRVDEHGGAEHDPEALWASVVSTGQRAVALAGGHVDAVAMANQGESVLAWNPVTGGPLTPVIVWHDRRSQSLVDGLAAHRDELEALTGLPLDTYFGAPKLAWIRANLTGDGVVTSSDSWLVHRMTGSYVTDVATASRMLLLDLDRGKWSARALEIFGLGAESMPTIVDNVAMVGTTDVFGPRDVPVTGLIVDQQAALLAQGCLRPGDVKCTYGTGAFLLAHSGIRPHRGSGGLVPSVAWDARGQRSYCLDGQVLAAGSALDWVVSMGLIPEAVRLDEFVDSEASSAGVTFVPSFAGLAAPQWDPSARGLLTGLSLGHTRGHVARAFVEGLAALVADLLEGVSLATGLPASRLKVDGGLTRSRALMQAQADISQVPVDVYASPHATALGAAALAIAAIDPSRDLVDIVGTGTAAMTYHPTMESARAQEIRAAVRHASGGGS